MVDPDWKYVETLEKTVRTIAVNPKDRHVDALDMAQGIPICLDAAVNINLRKIKRAKMYKVIIKLYTAELTGELENQLKEMSLNDSKLMHSLQALKYAGEPLKKYELLSIK